MKISSIYRKHKDKQVSTSYRYFTVAKVYITKRCA